MLRKLLIVCVLALVAAGICALEAVDSQLVSESFNEIAGVVNGNPNSTWHAAPNKFSSWTWAQVKRMLLRNYPRRERIPDAVIANMKMTQSNDIPESFDARTAWPQCLKPIRDQGKCGSCWAVSGASTLTDLFCVGSKGAFNKTLSPQDMVSCNWYNMGCNGGMLPTAWFYLKHTGIVDESCFPYVSGTGMVPKCPTKCNDSGDFKPRKHFAKTYHHLGSMFQPHERPTKIAQYIMTHGAAQTGFSVYQDFMTYKSGVYRHTTGSFLGGHAVKILGWGKDPSMGDYWIVANSWGTSWGNEGYFWIARGNNECGFEADAYSGEPKL